MSQDLSKELKELIEWGQGHNTHLHPDVEIYTDIQTGLSFRATKNIPKESIIVNCPYELSLSYLNAIEESPFSRHSSPPLPHRFIENLSKESPHIIGHFFLIQQYLLKEKSFWWPYIRTLPQPDEPEKLGTPIWWPEEDQAFLKGTNAEPAIKTQKQLLGENWKLGMQYLDSGGSDDKAWENSWYAHRRPVSLLVQTYTVHTDLVN